MYDGKSEECEEQVKKYNKARYFESEKRQGNWGNFSRDFCSRQALGEYLVFIDQDNIIHDYEQLTYTTTYKCDNKFFIYLLYQSQPKDMRKIYYIRIDAYNKVNMIYYSSWILPIKFLFLPVNRISAHLIIPAYPIVSINNCSIFCGHGQCFQYVNNQDKNLMPR